MAKSPPCARRVATTASARLTPTLRSAKPKLPARERRPAPPTFRAPNIEGVTPRRRDCSHVKNILAAARTAMTRKPRLGTVFKLATVRIYLTMTS
jgi:hypothetical protein